MAGVVTTWREAWREPGFARRSLLTLVVFVAAFVAHVQFLVWNQQRPGAVLDDPVLALFAPRDFSTLTFAVIFAAILVTFVALARHPARLVLLFQSYAVMVCVRMAMMYCVPLDPPPRIIPLRDPAVEILGGGLVLTRDLFFSGHTATLFLLFLALPRGWVRPAVLCACAAVAVLTVWQHTHYVIDVLVAPSVAYVSYVVVQALFAREASAPL